jgi:hypothetical protein
MTTILPNLGKSASLPKVAINFEHGRDDGSRKCSKPRGILAIIYKIGDDK